MAHVEVDQSGEKVIPTGGLGLSRPMTSSVELITDKSKPLIEIAEPAMNTRYDSESDNEECAWLANPGKIAPKKPVYEPPEPEEPEREPTPPPPAEPDSAEHLDHHSEPAERERADSSFVTDPIQAATSFLQSSSGVFSDTEDGIRRKKSFLLHQYSLKNKDKRYSSKNLTMDSDLREIQDELQFVETRKSMEGSLSLWKTGLVILSDGLVRMNERFDPFGVDMSEWSQRMWYDVMQKGSYDEVLLELVEKYKGTVPIGPELRLLTMLGMSFGGTLLTKKQEQTQLEKLRREQERHINAEVEARVRERMAAAASNPRPPVSKRAPPKPAPKPRSPSPELQGPTFTAEEIRDLMKNDLLDSSDEASEAKTPPRSVVSSPVSSRAPSPTGSIPAASTLVSRQAVSRSPSPIAQPAPTFETSSKRRGARSTTTARGARRGRGRGGDLIIALDKD